jgi:pimeloyl-ACP methyl ester carboxylesterase
MRPEVQQALARAESLEPMEAALELSRALCGSRYAFAEAAFREYARANAARGGANPKCAHGLAVQASPSRREALRAVRVPALVLHGSDDPILPVEHGRATAAAIPDAQLLIEEGAGHDLPEPVARRYAAAILDLLRRRS